MRMHKHDQAIPSLRDKDAGEKGRKGEIPDGNFSV